MVPQRVGRVVMLVVIAAAFLAFRGEVGAQVRYLVFSEEFSGTSIDRSVWSFGIGPTNDNVHYYTDRPDNAQLAGGELQIIARKESFMGSSYTSALLQTRNTLSWRYGRVEARIKMPAGAGFVPAFWMMPADDMYGWWPCSGEIDIVEHPTTEIDRIYGSAHARAYSYFTGTAPKTKSVQIPDAESAFHVYAIEWSAEQIDFYVDQTKYHTVSNDHAGARTWPFDRPFYIILNLAVGGGWVGNPGPSTAFPAMMEVDYVRVYQSLEDIGITGRDFVSTSAIGVSYSVPAVNGASYAWSVPPAAQITSGQGTRQILVNWGKTGGNVGATISLSGSSANPIYPVVVSNNLLNNSAIEKGVKYWKGTLYYPAKGAFDIDSAAQVPGNHWLNGVITTPGTNPWDAQFTQSGFVLEIGKQYEGRLKAKADLAGRPINVSVINAFTYSWYGGATFTLSDAWKEYTFRMAAGQTAVGSFNIDVGAQAGTYYFDDLSLVDLATQSGMDELGGLNPPGIFALDQNYPNPFNPVTVISCQVPVAGHVKLAVHDLLGREVAVLMNEIKESGRYEVRWDASGLASSVYICRMTAGSFTSSRKMILAR